MDARFQRWRGLSALVVCGLALAACGQGGADATSDAATASVEIATPAAPPEFNGTTLSALLEEMAGHFAGSPRCPETLKLNPEQDLCPLWAVHQMLTTRSASNGSVGGAFHIPYFWHWVEPNPRLAILRLPEGAPLGELPPPAEFGRYKTFGHIDRVPSLYLGDLVAEAPRYSHPRVGEFTTFGWCSEREMALCALLSTWGFEAKIHQEGIHVATRVWLPREGGPLELRLDTTFDTVELLDAGAHDLASWRADLGEGSDIAHYNGVCHDEAQLGRLVEMPVPEAARQRLAAMAAAYLPAPVIASGAKASDTAAGEWTTLQPGLDYRELVFGADGSRRESPVHVLRIDPAQSELVVEFSGRDDRGPLPAREWCRRLDLAAAINVGMFLPDHRNVGYARDGDFVSNPRWVKSYKSALAFGPRDASLPAAVMVDLDEEGARDALESYATVVQNLRLIKAPGVNVWSKQEKRWSEAAVATDREGRLLMIFTRAPFSMWELNRRLIDSPLGIVRAMHVEGGPEASLSIRTDAMTRDFSGNYETGFFETGTNTAQWSIPNILGVRKK